MATLDDYRVTSVVIEDDLEQLAPRATLRFVPRNIAFPEPDEGEMYELSMESDLENRGRLPKPGESASVLLRYNNVDLGAIFTGIISHADDFTDPDRYEYGITVAQVPVNEPHRNQITTVVSSPDGSGKMLSSHAILRRVARAANVSLDHLDIPDHDVWGSLDFIRVTLLQALQQMAQPFNLFDYLRYYVRYTPAGQLGILKVDFLRPRPAFSLNNALSVKRTFQRYSSDSRIGDTRILATGGENYNRDPEDLPESQDRTIRISGTARETYSYTTRNLTAVQLAETWVEYEALMEYDLEADVPVAGGDTVVPDIADTMAGNLALLQGGVFSDLRVVGTRILRRVQRQFGAVFGLQQVVTTNFSYANRTFDAGRLTVGTDANLSQCAPDGETQRFTPVTRNVLTYEETVTDIYPRGEEFHLQLAKRWYNYNDFGVVESTITQNYNGDRGEWRYIDTQVDAGDPEATTNAAIAFFQGFRAASVRQETVVPKTPIDVWRTLDGEIVEPTPVGAEECDQGEELPSGVYEISVPASGPNGLQAATQIALVQKRLERNRAYWEEATVRMLLDASVCVGFDASIADIRGKVVSFRHEITETEATTTVSLRRVREE
jgi:hypothetical protein